MPGGGKTSLRTVLWSEALLLRVVYDTLETPGRLPREGRSLQLALEAWRRGAERIWKPGGEGQVEEGAGGGGGREVRLKVGDQLMTSLPGQGFTDWTWVCLSLPGLYLTAANVVFSFSSSLSRDLLSNKDPEIRSIFQLVQAAQLRRSPSELFAQHIVSVLHYIKGRYTFHFLQHFHHPSLSL